MKVFISWSGASSRAVAEALHWWLPKVIQGVKPFVSAKDIDKGSNWTVELARELEDAEFGVVCLAPDNLASAWLNYEAGAITKSVESRVCPLLHGLQKADVQPPLNQLQLTSLEEEDVLLMMTSMNTAAGAPLSQADLKDAVDMWWPRLKERLDKIPVGAAAARTEATEPDQPETSTREMLEEILIRMRALDRKVERSVGGASTRVLPEGRIHIAMVSAGEAVQRAGLPLRTASTGNGTVSLEIPSELPAGLPSGLWRDLADIARRHKTGIVLFGKDRTVTFAADGSTEEPPF